MNISRIRQYVKALQECRNATKLSRLEMEKRIMDRMGRISSSSLEPFFAWLENTSEMENVDCADSDSLMCFIRQAQRAMHDYADVLDAAFRTDAGHLEKWLSIILKLGRYGTASRAFFQLARELSFFLNPSAFIRVFKRTLKMASKVVIFALGCRKPIHASYIH